MLNITLNVCIFALSGIQMASLFHHIMLDHLCPVQLCHTLCNYLLNGTAFGKYVFEMKYVFSFFSTVFMWNLLTKEEFGDIQKWVKWKPWKRATKIETILYEAVGTASDQHGSEGCYGMSGNMVLIVLV